MTLASLGRPGYRFKVSSQQQLFLYESLRSRRLASTSSEGRKDLQPDPESPPSSKAGKSGDSKGSTLFSPAPSKAAPLSASTASPKKSENNAEIANTESKPIATAEDKNVTKAKDEVKPEGRLAKAWAWVKHEANHYWDGSKLLAAEVRVSSKLLRKVLNGARLTRRERRQVRTANYNDIREILTEYQ